MTKKQKVLQAIEELKNTVLMKEYYKEKFLKTLKNNMHLSKEEKLKLLFEID